MDVLPFYLPIPLNFQRFPGIKNVPTNILIMYILNSVFSINAQKWNLLSTKYAYFNTYGNFAKQLQGGQRFVLIQLLLRFLFFQIINISANKIQRGKKLNCNFWKARMLISYPLQCLLTTVQYMLNFKDRFTRVYSTSINYFHKGRADQALRAWCSGSHPDYKLESPWELSQLQEPGPYPRSVSYIRIWKWGWAVSAHLSTFSKLPREF